MSDSKRIAVIGSGISGIGAAYYLKKAGHEPRIFEQDASIGGRMGSARLGDRWIDFGGKNIGRRYPLFREFVADQGDFSYEYFGVNTSQVLEGKLMTVSRERNLKAVMNLIKLGGVRGFLRLLRLARIVRKDPVNGALDSPHFNKLAERYDDAPLSEHFAENFANRIVRPIVVRMNGAEPNECYMGNFGTNVKMAFDKYDQIKEGMRTVVQRFVAGISVVTGVKATRLTRRGSDAIELTFQGPSGEQQEQFDGVVLATPALSAAELLEPEHGEVARELRRVRYFPVSVAIVRYGRDIFNDETRAVVFDRDHVLSNAGAYGINDLNLVRYTFSGQLARDRIHADLEPAEAITQAEQNLSKVFPVSEKDRQQWVYRHFPLGLCAYSPRHHRLLGKVRQSLQEAGRIALAGDYLRGASIETCFQSAKEAAAAVLQ